jgi:CBS domain-containing protein
MEARQHWAALELELDSLEGKLTQTGDHASESALASARQLAQTVVQFFKEHVQIQSALSTPVAAIMSRAVRTCLPTDSLNRAAQIMWENNCGAVPVVSPEGLVLGMITDRDICMASYTQGRNLAALAVEPAMSKGVTACSADEPISSVLEIMQASQVRRVPVIQAGKVAGIVALADIARWVERQRTGRGAAYGGLVQALAAISQAPAPSEATNPAQAAE